MIRGMRAITPSEVTYINPRNSCFLTWLALASPTDDGQRFLTLSVVAHRLSKKFPTPGNRRGRYRE